jgi:CRISPR-associated endonuclease/helicase Cas3
MLKQNKPILLVSTQCIEAGVDVDFPRLYRAYGPLDSLVQAAGRCNREGRRASGLVTIYEPEGSSLPGQSYRQATGKTKTKVNEWLKADPSFDDPSEPKLVNEYFRSLYDIAVTGKPEMTTAIKCYDFPEIRKNYRLIDQEMIQIVVPFGPEMELYNSLKTEAETLGIGRQWLGRAQRITVSEFRPKKKSPIEAFLLPLNFRPRRGTTTKDIQVPDIYIYSEPKHYDMALGLVAPDEMPEFIV